jgi:hypothetical protein
VAVTCSLGAPNFESNICDFYQNDFFSHIAKRLPKAYQPPFHYSAGTQYSDRASRPDHRHTEE